MRNKIYSVGILILFTSLSAFAQLNLPRDSQRAEIAQIVGDTRVAIVYHRPNAKGRKIYGCQTNDFLPKGGATYPCLVPYGQVWRTGANENTTFEVTNDVKINGQTLPAGKYGLHTIPNQTEWTIIFSKVNNSWGSFTYDAKQDQLRVTAKPQTVAESQETMSLGLENIKATTADVVIRWENVRVPFTIDVGDMNARVLGNIRQQMTNLKSDDFRTPIQAASWVFDSKLTANYAEAVGWVDKSLAVRETFGALSLKAQMLAATGRKSDAIATAEKAVQVGKAATPLANTANLEKMLADWKAGK